MTLPGQELAHTAGGLQPNKVYSHIVKWTSNTVAYYSKTIVYYTDTLVYYSRTIVYSRKDGQELSDDKE